MEEQTTIQKIVSQPSIKINKGMNGNYGWEIKLYGENLDEIIKGLEQGDKKLKEKFKVKDIKKEGVEQE